MFVVERVTRVLRQEILSSPSMFFHHLSCTQAHGVLGPGWLEAKAGYTSRPLEPAADSASLPNAARRHAAQRKCCSVVRKPPDTATLGAVTVYSRAVASCVCPWLFLLDLCPQRKLSMIWMGAFQDRPWDRVCHLIVWLFPTVWAVKICQLECIANVMTERPTGAAIWAEISKS